MINKDFSAFIEELVVKYDLEKELIENDLVLKNKLSNITDYADRAFIKFIFSEKISELVRKNIPIDIPSIKIRKIILDLINKKISLENLSLIIQNDLKISPETAEKISDDIKKNRLIIESILEAPEPTEETTPTEEKKERKSLGSELLK